MVKPAQNQHIGVQRDDHGNDRLNLGPAAREPLKHQTRTRRRQIGIPKRQPQALGPDRATQPDKQENQAAA